MGGVAEYFRNLYSTRSFAGSVHNSLRQAVGRRLTRFRKTCGFARPLEAEVATPEGRDYKAVLQCFYKTAFGRFADEAGLSYWEDRLRGGLSLAELAEQLVNSPEFQAQHGNRTCIDNEYVTTIYRQGFEREPDPEGLAFWLDAGEKGLNRAGMLLAFASSPEMLERYARPLLNRIFRMALGRSGDEDGSAYFLQRLKVGISLESIAEEVINSVEHRSQFGSEPAVNFEYVSALCRNGLGREPNLSELALWLGKAKKGATRSAIVAALANSAGLLDEEEATSERAPLSYEKWIAVYDTIAEADRVAIRFHTDALPARPFLSIILPVNTRSCAGLEESVSSVCKQLYPYWELCLCIDSTRADQLIETLHDVILADPRIRIIHSENCQNIADLANAGLASFTGDFVGFLRPADILSEHALYEVAVELGAHPQAQIVYTDCDEINQAGERLNPWFKPGWDPDLLLAQDYINNFVVYRRALIKEVGSLHLEFTGLELHQLALRATAATTPNLIRHIPAILYHRSSKHGLNDDILTFPINSEKLLHKHLDEQGNRNARLNVVESNPRRLRILWPLPEELPLVSVIIPTLDKADLLHRCVQGLLLRTDYHNIEILIIDNGSVEAATHQLFEQLIADDSRVRVLKRPGSFNYSALNNFAASESAGSVLLLLNNDVDVIHGDWLHEMVSQAVRPDVGIVGAKLLYADGRIQHGGVVLGPDGAAVHVHRFKEKDYPGYFGQLAFARSLSAVTAACVAIRRQVFSEVGKFDENLQVTFNDVDLCLRIGDYGYRVVWTPFAELYHLESASRGADNDDQIRQKRSQEEWGYLRSTWGDLLDSDPFHNPNLLFHFEGCDVPSAPRRKKPWRFIVKHVPDLNRVFPT